MRSAKYVGGTEETTLVAPPAVFLTAEDRAVLFEDTAELPFDSPNLVLFEARGDQSGLLPITIRDLLRARLRHRLGRALVGEVRSAEAFDPFHALNIGQRLPTRPWIHLQAVRDRHDIVRDRQHLASGGL